MGQQDENGEMKERNEMEKRKGENESGQKEEKRRFLGTGISFNAVYQPGYSSLRYLCSGQTLEDVLE